MSRARARGMRQYYNSYWYTARQNDCCDCCDFEAIWCYPCLQDMSTEWKSIFSKNISKHRNYAVILYAITAIVDFACLSYYGGTGMVLLFANGCCGVFGTLNMNIILVMCNYTWVSVVMCVQLFLILATFLVAKDQGYQLVAILIPTVIDIVFMCAILPFLFKLCWWFDKAKQAEKAGFQMDQALVQNVRQMPQQDIEKGLRTHNLQSSYSQNLAQQQQEQEIIEMQEIELQPSQPVVQAELYENSNLCVVCLDKKIDTVFYKCGHMCCCESCSFKVRRDKCPMCRQKIDDVIKTYNVT